MAVPVAGVGVPHDAVVQLQFHRLHGVFLLPAALTDVHRDYLCHHASSKRYSPLLPPVFVSRRILWMRMSFCTALHIS